MSVSIVPIAESYAEGFRRCLDVVAREKKYLTHYEAPPLESVQAFLRDNIAKGVAQFIALEDQRVVGWCDILPGWAPAIQHCGILGMGLLPDYRGRGIGRQLLNTCLVKARTNGITRVELVVRADNYPAIGLYERMGFQREALRRNDMRFDGVYFDSIQMRLLLEDTVEHFPQPA